MYLCMHVYARYETMKKTFPDISSDEVSATNPDGIQNLYAQFFCQLSESTTVMLHKYIYKQ